LFGSQENQRSEAREKRECPTFGTMFKSKGKQESRWVPLKFCKRQRDKFLTFSSFFLFLNFTIIPSPCKTFETFFSLSLLTVILFHTQTTMGMQSIPTKIVDSINIFFIDSFHTSK